MKSHHGKKVGAGNSKCFPTPSDFMHYKGRLVRRHHRNDKTDAIANKIPKALRMYANQYGSSVAQILQLNKQFPN